MGSEFRRMHQKHPAWAQNTDENTQLGLEAHVQHSAWAQHTYREHRNGCRTHTKKHSECIASHPEYTLTAQRTRNECETLRMDSECVSSIQNGCRNTYATRKGLGMNANHPEWTRNACESLGMDSECRRNVENPCEPLGIASKRS
jgi:hypothetical protein